MLGSTASFAQPDYIRESLPPPDKEYPQDFFGIPVDTPLYLAGNFGELRLNHFHAGLDMKTMGQQGKPIYAAGDGFVSRVNISRKGYGKLLYVEHPNGYTSVYGHLRNFAPNIEQFLFMAQKLREAYEVDVYPGEERLPVKKGDLIAYSGNTGGSRAPHLHFEIRETETNNPVNPMYFGYKIKDDIKPRIFNIRAYPFGDSSHVYNRRAPKTYHTYGYNGNYKLAKGQVIKGYGKIGLAVDATDKMNDTHNIYGIHEIRMFVDSQLVFSQKLEKLDFRTNRYMNGHTDYRMLLKAKRNYHRTHLLPNNDLEIYELALNDGMFDLKPGDKHQVKFELKDYDGNTSEANMILQGMAPITKAADTNFTQMIYWATENTFRTGDLTIYFPPKSIYEDLKFKYRMSDTITGGLTPVHRVHNNDIPVQEEITVKIKTPELPEKIADKALIVTTGAGGYKKPWPGCKYRDGWISTRVNMFGSFTVVVDTIAPWIKPVSFYNRKKLTWQKYISFSIGDKLSGIDDFDLYIDDEWVLSEYEPKNSRLKHRINPATKPGEHKLKLVISDERGNKKEYNATFLF